MTPRTLQAFRDFDSVVTRLSESLSLPIVAHRWNRS